MAVQGLTTSFSVYDLFGTQPMSTSTNDVLAKAYQANAEKQITKQQKLIANQSQVKIDAAKREMARWTPLTDGINSAQDNLNSAVSKAQSLDQTLFNMIDTLNTPTNISGDWSSQAARFDGLLSAITSMTGDDDPTNLLGSRQRGNTYQPNEVSYQASPNPQDQVTVYGSYAGSDTKITMADGTFWMPLGSQGIQNYTLYPVAPIGYPQSTGSGATTLDTPFNESSITFTTGQTVQNPQTYTGSVQRAGLGVMQSWLYDGLATPDGRARALQDIQNARTKLESITSSLTASQGLVAGDLAKVQQNIDDQAKLMTQLSTDANKEVQTYVTKVQAQVQQQLNAAVNVGATPVVQMIHVGGRVGRLFDLLT